MHAWLHEWHPLSEVRTSEEVVKFACCLHDRPVHQNKFDLPWPLTSRISISGKSYQLKQVSKS
jgi:hypothetical protein